MGILQRTWPYRIAEMLLMDLQYNGTMSRKARSRTIDSFGKPGSKCQVMVASLKCGGIGCESFAGR